MSREEVEEKLVIKYWNPSLAKDLQYLFKAVFNKHLSLEDLIAKNDPSHLGLESVATIGYIDNEPVGFYGAVLQKFIQEDQHFFALQACDFITLQKYQRKGIHQLLGKKSYEKAKAQGITFVYGFHSVQSERASNKLGWVNVNLMEFLEIDISVNIFKKGKNKLVGSPSDAFFNDLEDFKLHSENFQNDYIKEGFLANEYSTGEVNYRSFSANGVFNIKGCNLWLKVDNILHIGYFDPNEKENFLSALEFLKEKCKTHGIHKISIHAMKDTKQYDILNQIGETSPSWKIGFLPFDSAPDPSTIRLNYVDFDTF